MYGHLDHKISLCVCSPCVCGVHVCKEGMGVRLPGACCGFTLLSYSWFLMGTNGKQSRYYHFSHFFNTETVTPSNTSEGSARLQGCFCAHSKSQRLCSTCERIPELMWFFFFLLPFAWVLPSSTAVTSYMILLLPSFTKLTFCMMAGNTYKKEGGGGDCFFVCYQGDLNLYNSLLGK